LLTLLRGQRVLLHFQAAATEAEVVPDLAYLEDIDPALLL